MALVVVLGAVPGCRKKDDKAALEAVETGKKPPVVHRKAKDAGAEKAEAADKAGADQAGADKLAAGGRPPAAAPLDSAKAIDAARSAAAAPPAAAPAPTPGAPGSPVVALQPSPAAPTAPGSPVVALQGEPPTGRPAAEAAAPEAPAAEPKVEAKAAEEDKKPAEVRPEAAATDRPGGVMRDRKGPEPAPAPEAPPAPLPVAHEARDGGEPPLDVSGYISAMDLELVLGTKAKFRRSDLPGVPASPSYNALYYEPEKGDHYGVSVQVWRDGNLAESRTRFNTMRNSYSNVAPTNKVTEQGFRSFYSGVVTVVFADPRRPLVAAVACSTKLCNADQLLHFAKNVSERLR